MSNLSDTARSNLPHLLSSVIYSGISPSYIPSFDTGLIDTYPAAMAFSVRQLSSTATSCMRVKRSSDNAEADIGFAYNASYGGYWIDEAALLAHCGASDGYVVTWYDQSGNGRNATAIGSPRIVGSGVVDKVNSRPAVRGYGQYFGLVGIISSLTYAAAYLVARSMQNPGVGATEGLFWFSTASNTNPRLGIRIAAGASAQLCSTGRRADGNSTSQTLGGNPFTNTLRRYTAIANYGAAALDFREAGTNHAGSLLSAGASSSGTPLQSLLLYGPTAWTGECAEAIFYTASTYANTAAIEADSLAAWGGGI